MMDHETRYVTAMDCSAPVEVQRIDDEEGSFIGLTIADDDGFGDDFFVGFSLEDAKKLAEILTELTK